MTKEEIIEMAKLAGWEMDDSFVLEPEIVWYICQGQLERFAKLIAQKEREKCAKICDYRVNAYQYATDPWAREHIEEAKHLAELIRTRGKSNG